MERHPLRVWRESKGTRDQLEALLAPDVVFHSPIFREPVRGRDLVVEVMLRAGAVREGAYVHELRNGGKAVLVWEGAIRGHKLQSFELIEDDANGKVAVRTVAMRPYHVVTLFREAMREGLGNLLPEHFW
jgi:hypothetical protein